MNISNIRREYMLQELCESCIQKDPFQQFDLWWQQAIQGEVFDVNAMSLGTANVKTHSIDVRIVLLKSYSKEGFIFFTNYESQKAKNIEQNPHVCILFFWKELERQIKIKGIAKKISKQESENYFHSRPIESQWGAWASNQSQKITNREELEKAFEDIKKKYANQVPKPPYWGGYIIEPDYFEFWQGRPSRLHDRIVYEKNQSHWQISRLAP